MLPLLSKGKQWAPWSGCKQTAARLLYSHTVRMPGAKSTVLVPSDLSAAIMQTARPNSTLQLETPPSTPDQIFRAESPPSNDRNPKTATPLPSTSSLKGMSDESPRVLHLLALLAAAVMLGVACAGEPLCRKRCRACISVGLLYAKRLQTRTVVVSQVSCGCWCVSVRSEHAMCSIPATQRMSNYHEHTSQAVFISSSYCIRLHDAPGCTDCMPHPVLQEQVALRWWWCCLKPPWLASNTAASPDWQLQLVIRAALSDGLRLQLAGPEDRAASGWWTFLRSGTA